ncbi:hypothetical protein BG011_008877 [Mortierella polycephala]|uniref:Homeobox domain-containing protein n=1 Tax=Mortierella polycephala TaxID=41804 RepID=A0A9P6PPQ7_9FUNG|nr:hypothetical protein BG011_008877 [Mortierella polycephala]
MAQRFFSPIVLFNDPSSSPSKSESSFKKDRHTPASTPTSYTPPKDSAIVQSRQPLNSNPQYSPSSPSSSIQRQRQQEEQQYDDKPEDRDKTSMSSRNGHTGMDMDIDDMNNSKNSSQDIAEDSRGFGSTPQVLEDTRQTSLDRTKDISSSSNDSDSQSGQSSPVSVAIKRGGIDGRPSTSTLLVSPPSSYSSSSSSSMDALAKTLSPARIDMHRKKVQRMLQHNSLLWWELVRYTRNLERKEREQEQEKEQRTAQLAASSKTRALHHYHHHHHHHNPTLPPLHPQQHTLPSSKSLPSLKSMLQKRPHPYDHTVNGTSIQPQRSRMQIETREHESSSSTAYCSASTAAPATQVAPGASASSSASMASRTGPSDFSPSSSSRQHLSSTHDSLPRPVPVKPGSFTPSSANTSSSSNAPSATPSPGSTTAQCPRHSTPPASSSASAGPVHRANGSGGNSNSNCNNSTNGHENSNMDPNRKRRGNLPKSVTSILKNWLVQHATHPYPTEDEKMRLSEETRLSMNQISNWFINARRRILQPILVEVAAAAVAGTDAPMDNVMIVRKGKGSRMQVEVEGAMTTGSLKETQPRSGSHSHS